MKSAYTQDIQTFQELEREYLRQDSKAKSRVGYLCLRVPPEYIQACRAVPLRIIPRSGYDPSGRKALTSHKTLTGFTDIRTDACSFCRSVPAILQTESYHNLNAIIGGACCDQMRRLMDTLQKDLDIPVILFGAPRTWNADRGYFRAEMHNALCRIAEISGHVPTQYELWDRIRINNKLKLIVNRLRHQGKLSNSLLQKIASSPLPPEKVIEHLKGFENRHPITAEIKLMLAGSIPGTWELEVIEGNGARVTADVTCQGDRVFHDPVVENGDPLAQLYETYVENNLCPHRRPVTPLIEYMRELAAQRHVDGVIYRSVKYCHPWGLLAERMRNELGLPTLIVDDDLTSPAVESFRTRVGAFIEMLKMKLKKTA